MIWKSILIAINLFILCWTQDDECDVCISLCEGFKKSKDVPTAIKNDKITAELTDYCESLHNEQKEWKVCQNIGAVDNAPTSLMGDVNKFYKSNLPCSVICQKLKKMDPQICEYRFAKELQASDLTHDKLKKYKVSKLKKILRDWGEEFNFAEKSDFVKKIEEVKHKYLKEEL